MRVLHLVADGGPSAASKQLRWLTSTGLVESRVVAISAPCGQLTIKPDLARASRRLFDWPFVRRLRALVREFQPAVVHAWDIAPSAAAFWTRVAGHRGRLIVSCRRIAADQALLGPTLARRWGVRIDRVVVPAEPFADVLSSQFPGSAVTVVPDVLADETSTPALANLRQQLGLPESARLVFCAAPFDVTSALRDLIWSIDLLRVIRDDVHLALVGHGPWDSRLRHFSQTIGTGRNVHFLGRRDSLAPWLAQADIYAQPGYCFTPPLAMLEAIATGRPVIAADSPGIRQVVENETSARLIPWGDRAALAREINRLLDQPELARQLAATAKQRFPADHAPAQMRQAYEQLYAGIAQH
ncbi:MAG: glycosyltransferase family 4 protein [Planctomycetes bacterium]|nr:glycosyltransferase family 4 protein [Planctomycetota bacterium]